MKKIVYFILILTGACLAITAVARLFFSYPLNLLQRHGIDQIIFYLLVIAVIAAFQRYVNGASLLDLGLRRHPGRWRRFWGGWLFGFAALGFYLIVVMLFRAIDLRASFTAQRLLIYFFIAFTAFPIAFIEELIFRGFFLKTLLEDRPAWLAVFLSAFAFAFVHMLPDKASLGRGEDWMMFAGMLCLGLFLGYCRVISGSLYLPMGFHAGLVFLKILERKLDFVVYLKEYSIFYIHQDLRKGAITCIMFLLLIPLVREWRNWHTREKTITSIITK